MNRNPDKINSIGTKVWYDEDEKFHNDFGPAIIYTDGYNAWYKHGLYHNENGPAVILSSGYKFWYIDGKEYTEDQFKQYKIKQFTNEE